MILIKSNNDKYKMAQRVLSFKKKTRLTVLNMHSKLCTHPFLLGGGVGWTSNPIFKKGGTWQDLDF